MTNKITLRPIGFAKSKVKSPRFGNFAGETTEIIIDKRFADSLDGIEGYSHIIVVYWMDRIKDYLVKHRPQGNPGVPVVGIFACRCPQRPNPIAITTVRLLGRRRNVLTVIGLDVLDGTPVIDIKPYWPQYDKAGNAKIPRWVYKLKF